MKLNIAVLPGDGIGPEISVQGVEVMSAVCEKFGHEVHYEYALCGADAIDKVDDPFPEETYRICKDADAVLFSAVGDPKFDNDPTAKVRPEQGLLAMRKKLGLFANIRPVQTFKCLLHKSPLRAELVDGADFLCIRELTGGMYFGEKYQDNDKAYDTNMYTRPEIERKTSQNNEKTFTEQYKNAPQKFKELYDELSDYATSLGDDVSQSTLKLYSAFKKIKNFCTMEVYQAKMLINFRLNPDDYELSGTLRDVRNIGHWGCGDLQLIMRDRSEIEKAKQLILKAYENN